MRIDIGEVELGVAERGERAIRSRGGSLVIESREIFENAVRLVLILGFGAIVFGLFVSMTTFSLGRIDIAHDVYELFLDFFGSFHA